MYRRAWFSWGVLFGTPRKKNRKKESAPRAALAYNWRRGVFFFRGGEQTAEPRSTPERSGANAGEAGAERSGGGR